MADMVFARQFGVQQMRKADQQQRVADFAARPYFLVGQFMMRGAGEVSKEIAFPVTFIEKPFFFIGGNLDDNQATVIGALPTISGAVIEYRSEMRGIDQRLYRGALVSAVTTGLVTQNAWVHYMFVGTALTNPTAAAQTADGVV